jgi:hypothetical protein
VLIQEAFNPFVECRSCLAGGEGLSITLKLSLERSDRAYPGPSRNYAAEDTAELVQNIKYASKDIATKTTGMTTRGTNQVAMVLTLRGLMIQGAAATWP